MRTKLDVEREINDLARQIDTLAESRSGITQGLRELKAKIGGRMLPPGQFQSMQAKRLKLTADMNANLNALRQIKARSRLLHEEREEMRLQPGNVIPKGTIEELVTLRDYYQEYAGRSRTHKLDEEDGGRVCRRINQADKKGIEMDDLKKFEIAGPSMIIFAESDDDARQKYLDLLDPMDLDCEEME